MLHRLALALALLSASPSATRAAALPSSRPRAVNFARLAAFSANDLQGVMARTADELPALPSYEATQAFRSDIKTAPTSGTAASRYATLRLYWRTAFPAVPLSAFVAWALPLYSASLANLNITADAHLRERYRVAVFGVYVVAVALQPKGLLHLNHFALLDPDAHARYTGLLPDDDDDGEREPSATGINADSATRLLQTLPASLDMRAHPLFPLAVKNQGACGSCWAYTSAGTMSIQNIFENGELMDVSEQAFISCGYFTQGCNGGTPENAWKWALYAGGVPLESRYPDVDYTPGNVPWQICNSTRLVPAAVRPTSEAAYLPTASPQTSAADMLAVELAFIAQIVAGRPITLEIAAGSPCFQTYSPDQTLPVAEQMLTCACGGTSDPIDHTILIVGYTPQYFIARNQWGPYWGVNGYVYLPRNSANPGLNLPGYGPCNMYYRAMYLPSVAQLVFPPTQAPVPTLPPSVTPTAEPTRKTTPKPTRKAGKEPTAQPTTLSPLSTGTCPTVLPTPCPKRCCRSACAKVGKKRACLADATKMCCANGLCAKLQVKGGKVRATCG